jgi:hypothetical protein
MLWAMPGSADAPPTNSVAAAAAKNQRILFSQYLTELTFVI